MNEDKNGILPKKKILNDVILVLCILVFAIMAFVLFFTLGDEGDFAVVTVDGNEVGRYSLYENITVEIPTAQGSNTLLIENGIAYVSEADCPDKICKAHRGISKSGETIVCLPHKLVVSVESDKSEGPDTVS